MVGIILATHGNFAKTGIQQSASMIFWGTAKRGSRNTAAK